MTPVLTAYPEWCPFCQRDGVEDGICMKCGRLIKAEDYEGYYG